MHSLHLTELHYYLTTQDTIEYVWCALLTEQLDTLTALPQHHGRVCARSGSLAQATSQTQNIKHGFC